MPVSYTHLWVNEKNLTLLGNTDVHDVIERLYDFQTTTHRPIDVYKRQP